MNGFSLLEPLTACAIVVFGSDPSWHWQRRRIGSASRHTGFLPLTFGRAGAAAGPHPLTFADLLNLF